MSHPHILPLFDSGEASGFLFYVMSYVEGETIREKLNRETQCGIAEAIRIASEVADALVLQAGREWWSDGLRQLRGFLRDTTAG